MIRFPCRCGEPLEVPEDQAGLTLQCPRCGLLCDVPTFSDMASLEADGSYKIDAPKIQADPNALPELRRVFTRHKLDASGNEIDLRGPAQDALPDAALASAAGDLPVSLPSDPFAEPVRDIPRYDPETGELIVPLTVAPTPAVPAPPAKLPLATAVANYSPTHGYVSMIAEPSPQGLGILAALLRPLNLLVIIVYAVALAMELAVLLMVTGFFLAAAAASPGVPPGGLRVLIPLLAFVLLAFAGSQLANTVEDTGPCERDEIPRPLRDVSLFEDLWNPALRVALAAFLAYGPGIAWRLLLETTWGGRLMAPAQVPGDWLLYGLGTFFFPALLLTLCTSGTLRNLRPDRVLGVIATSGFGYALPLLLWVALALIPRGLSLAVPRLQPWFAWPLLVGGTPLLASYLVHALGWTLGDLYRRHQEQFPWVLQRHERTTPRRAFQVLPAARRRGPAPVRTPAPPPKEIR